MLLELVRDSEVSREIWVQIVHDELCPAICHPLLPVILNVHGDLRVTLGKNVEVLQLAAGNVKFDFHLHRALCVDLIVLLICGRLYHL